MREFPPRREHNSASGLIGSVLRERSHDVVSEGLTIEMRRVLLQLHGLPGMHDDDLPGMHDDESKRAR
jgi:hypothetical protein